MLLRSIAARAATTVLFAVSLPVGAAIIDINQPNGDPDMAAFWQTGLAQSFTAISSNISGAGILLYEEPIEPITISLWSALPNAGGVMLASSAGPSPRGGWFDVFWSPVATTPTVSYYLLFESDSDPGGVAGDVFNPYSGGNLFANAGFQPFPDYDFAFRTYTTPDNQAVPVPGGIWLMGCGLAVLTALRRLQRTPH